MGPTPPRGTTTTVGLLALGRDKTQLRGLTIKPNNIPQNNQIKKNDQLMNERVLFELRKQSNQRKRKLTNLWSQIVTQLTIIRALVLSFEHK